MPTAFADILPPSACILLAQRVAVSRWNTIENTALKEGAKKKGAALSIAVFKGFNSSRGKNNH
jgi:hypothetical protein